MFIILSVIIFFTVPNFHFINFIAGALYFKEVIIYLFGTSILKAALINIRTKNINIIDEKEIYYYGFLSTFAFGLATPSFIKGIFPESNYTWLTRWVCISMFFLPTTVASAYIFDTLNIKLTSILIIGLPLLPLFIYFFPIKLVYNKKVVILSGIAVVNIGLILLLRTYIGISLLFGQAIIFFVTSYCICKKMKFMFYSIMKTAASESLANSIFFISIGFFMISFKNSAVMQYINAFSFHSFYFCMFFTLILIPIITIFFIHPLLLYAALSTKINLCLKSYFAMPEIYLIWVFVFIAAQLCSPASIASILASKNEHLSILKVSVLRHFRFCIQVLLIVLSYLFIVKMALSHS